MVFDQMLSSISPLFVQSIVICRPGRGIKTRRRVLKLDSVSVRTSCRCQSGIQNAGTTSAASRVSSGPTARRDLLSSEDLQTQSVRPAIPVTAADSALGQMDVALALSNAIEKFIDKFMMPTPSLRTDPVFQMSGNFAPVPECPPVSGLEVVGHLPECLDGGVYIRNGPNPRILPESGYHMFDGDGMLHAVSFKNGGATYACRFTETNKFLHEHRSGQLLFVRPLGEMQGIGGLAKMALLAMKHAFGILNLFNGFGPANAGMAFHHGKLFAMSESDLPYAVRVEDGDIHTKGRHDFDGKLSNSMTAHPKIDRRTGELFCYSYDVLLPPYLKYFWVSADGVKQDDIPIAVPGPVLMHDFAITENYTIFPDTSMRFSLLEMLKGNSVMVTDEEKIPRYGVLPKYAHDCSSIRWFSVPNSTCFHYYNAWEEEEDVVLCGSMLSPLSNIFDNPMELSAKPSEIRLNMRTGKVSVRQIANVDLDVATINYKFYGSRNKFAYASITGPFPKYAGIAKIDLHPPKCDAPLQQHQSIIANEPAIVGWRKVTGCFTSEPWFVPRTTDSGAAEDDGYVLAFSHNETTDQSELLVLDAQSPTLEQVASVKIPSRVPYGYHGIFLTKEEVAQL